MDTDREMTCRVCGKAYTWADAGHRHRAVVSVPMKPYGEPGAIRWKDVGVLVNLADIDGERDAVNRAVRQIHGARACWMPDNGVPGMGQVMRGEMFGRGMDAVTGRVVGCHLFYTSKGVR